MSTPKVIFNSVQPEYGVNYGRGWIGFNHAESWFSQGIAVATRWERASDITVSHVFIVSGEDECIEAAFPRGVVVSSLREQYFDRDDRPVIFRKPRGLTPDLADRIVAAAREQVGAEFNHGVLATHMTQNGFLGYVVNALFNGKPKELMDSLVNQDNAWICSELAAHALSLQPEFRERGCLTERPGTISPQRLFEAEELFEPLDPGPKKEL